MRNCRGTAAPVFVLVLDAVPREDGTRNTKHEIPNTKPETQDSEPGTPNPKPETAPVFVLVLDAVPREDGARDVGRPPVARAHLRTPKPLFPTPFSLS